MSRQSRPRLRHVTVDAEDPYALARFWAEALGGRIGDDDAPGDPDAQVLGVQPPLLFVQVPPRGSAGARKTHLDVQAGHSRAEEVARLAALGASVSVDRTRDDGTGWYVLTDPEGNEFCVVRGARERGEPEPVDTGERAFPDVHAAPERATLEGLLEWYREGVLRKVDGMRQEDATTSPLRSGTTAAGLVRHLAYVEDAWCTWRLAGRPQPEPWASAPFDDDPDWDFSSAAGEPLEASAALYRAACERSRAVAAARGLDDTAVDERGRTISLRFVLVHLLEETARHLGHLDLLRELADGSTGE